jgi:hypothetical protein
MAGTVATPIGFILASRSKLDAPSIDDSLETLEVDSATSADAPMVIDTITEAFLTDPTWSWAFPDSVKRKRFWKICVAGALRFSWVYKTSGFETVSIWIPPNGSELLPEDEEKLPEVLTELAGPRAAQVAELLHRFEKSHPRTQPHYYLSLLGTRNEQRGRGLGMSLLKENLARIDAERMPAYLESSNPANNHRYASVGFVPVVSFQAPDNGPIVTGMWRQRQS